MPVFLRKGILPLLVAFVLLALITTITFFSKLSSNHLLADFQQADAATVSPYVEANGSTLSLYGEHYQFTGFNAFNLATLPGANAGCGGYVEDLDGFFSKLRPNSMVRMWAFQGTMAINPETKKVDWSGLDRVVNAAQKNNIKLIFVLTEQAGACDDGHWKDLSWYQGGYKQSFNDFGNGLTPIPYLDYVKQIVTRYKDSPAVAMWEPVNEGAPADCTNGKKGDDCWAYQTCPSETAAAEAMKTFFDAVGGTIKNIDPNHLVSSGVIGSGQCGAVYGNYKYIHESNGIDVGSYHDYSHIDEPMPGDQWNGLQFRIEQLKSLNKPLIIGEVGMMASPTGSGCITYAARHDKMKAKMDAQFAAGIAGLMPWSYTGGVSSSCNYDIVANDPLLTLLHDYPVSMGGIAPAPSSTPFPTPTPKLPDTQPPSAPTNLRTTDLSPTQLTLTWNASTDNEKVSRYDIYRDYWYVTSTTGTSLTNTKLTPGKKYMYYVKARDTSDNTSVASNKLTVTTPTSESTSTPTPTPTPTPSATPTTGPDTQAPSIPTGLTATAVHADKVTLTWNPSTDNLGVARYEIYRDYQYVTATVNTTITNTTVKPETKYVYYIKARDAAGNSSGASGKLVVTTPAIGAEPTPTPTPTPTPSATPTTGPDTQAPSAPTNLRTSALAPTQLTLTWNAATDNVGVVRYDIFRDYWYVTSTTGTSLTNTKLTPGTKYMYYVKARDAAGFSSVASNKLTVTTPLQ